MNPAGKTVIITGASAGIGAATAHAFAAAGARLVLVARDPHRLQQLVDHIPGMPLPIAADLADPAAPLLIAERSVASFGRIDIVIHNAGVGLAAPIATLNPSDLTAALAVNLFAPLTLTQAVLPHMQPRGQLIFISSVVGLRALPFAGGYAASKAALDRIVEALRVELLGSGVAVTLVRPGTTSTGFNMRRLGANRDRRRITPRGGPPERVAQAILRAANREPREVYVTLGDRLITMAALLAPGLIDQVLRRIFVWEDPPVL
ncbi:MAG TPA: SDR family NAD(P)-dependent oxidoreductase [Roseiflexaceae bacterium]|nr:SDR family NAD(P)-dependent oxidoreductase [Roseiflexaceae bacterium]